MPTITLPSGAFAAHAVTLAAGAETIVELGVDASQVEVTCTAATQPVYFTVDGTAATVAGDHAYALVPGLNWATVSVPGEVGLARVRLISAAPATVSVVKAG